MRQPEKVITLLVRDQLSLAGSSNCHCIINAIKLVTEVDQWRGTIIMEQISNGLPPGSLGEVCDITGQCR